MKLTITVLCLLSLTITKGDQGVVVTDGLSNVGLASMELITDSLGTEYVIAPPEFPQEIEQLLRDFSHSDSIKRVVAIYMPATTQRKAQLLGGAITDKGQSEPTFLRAKRANQVPNYVSRLLEDNRRKGSR